MGIVTSIEKVPLRLGIVIVTAVADGIEFGYFCIAGYFCEFAPRIIIVICYYGSVRACYGSYVILRVLYVVIFRAVADKTKRIAVVIIHKDEISSPVF